jgi:hypothetical protein
MRRVAVLALVVALGAQLGLAGESQEQSPGAKVLGRWVGPWRLVGVLKPAGWTPQESRVVETKACRWVLGGAFLEESGRSEEPKREYRLLSCYDQKDRVYRSWHFTSEGGATEWTGTWDAKTASMTWTSDLGMDVEAKMVARFHGPDRYTITCTAKDKAGKLLLDVTAENTSLRQ